MDKQKDMPFPAWGAAAVQGGASIGGTIASGAFNASTNNRNRFFAQQQGLMEDYINRRNQKEQRQYDEQIWKRDNDYMEGRWNQQNEYNERVWQQQNMYNEKMRDEQRMYDSPEAQMKRFKEAGLNPALMYGQMGSAGSPISAGNMNTQDIGFSPGRSASRNPTHLSRHQFTAPNFDIERGVLSVFDAVQKSVQTNNLEKLNQLADEQISTQKQKTALEAANVQKVLQDTRFDSDTYKARESITNYQSQALEQDIKKTKQSIDLEARRFQMAYEKQIEEITNMRESRKLTQLEQEVRRVDLDLRKQGINPGDPGYWRIMMYFYNAAKRTYDNLGDTYGPVDLRKK